MSSPAQVAALIGGIRTAQPGIRASAIEALLLIASGVDSAAELQRRMQIDPSSAGRIVSQLTGRGTLGRSSHRSNLRLVQRRRHPHRRGMQLALTAEARTLISSTFALPTP